MESHRGLLVEQEDPTQRRLFLCGFHRPGAGGADRALQLPLPRAQALFPASPGSCEAKQRIQGMTSSSLIHVLGLQGPDRKQSQKESRYTGLLSQLAEQIERLQSKMKKAGKKKNPNMRPTPIFDPPKQRKETAVCKRLMKPEVKGNIRI